MRAKTCISSHINTKFLFTPSHPFTSFAPHVRHSETGFGSPNAGSVTSGTSSITLAEILAYTSHMELINILQRQIKYRNNILPNSEDSSLTYPPCQVYKLHIEEQMGKKR